MINTTERLNHEIRVRLNRWTHQELQSLSTKTGIPQSVLVRAMINRSLIEIKGSENDLILTWIKK